MSRLLLVVLPSLLLVVNCGGGSGGKTQDPLVDGFPMAYIKRLIPVDDPAVTTDQFDALLQKDSRQPAAYYPGGDLYIRDHASSRAAERSITGNFTQGLGDVKDVDVSYDGTKLLFAMRAGDLPNTDPRDQPTWNIWEYNISTNNLHRIIVSDNRSEEGQDVSPTYLPDGRIIFASTRQRRAKAILVDEGKPRFPATLENNRDQHAFNLHIMDPDGSNIRQLTFNQAHDLDPMVRSDGKVIFTRWNRLDNQGTYMSNFYSMNPDGTDIQLMYGANSHTTGSASTDVQFLQPKEFPDGRIMAILKPFAGNFGGGDIVLFDIDNFADFSQPVQAGVPGTGQIPATNMSVRTDTVPSSGGRFAAAYPLWDGSNRSLVIWNQCRLLENQVTFPCTEERLASPTAQEAAPIYSIYMYDHTEQTLLPVILPLEGVMYSEVVIAQERAFPTVIFDKTTAEDDPGILHIRSVYDIDGTFSNRGATTVNTLAEMADPSVVGGSQRPARFIRLVKAVSMPDNNTNINGQRFGPQSGLHGLKEIIGYAPIEPDGSVKVRVPANVAFTFHILDANGRRLTGNGRGPSRHTNYWLQVRPGETLECNGCHDGNTTIPHGRIDAVSSINSGAPASGRFPGTPVGMTGQSGETMAEIRTRISCQTDCEGLNPAMGIIFEDIWADAAPEDPFSYLYQQVYDYANTQQKKPVTESCATKWTPGCRAVISYGEHIHPIWTRPRGVDSGGQDMTCVNAGCHSTRNAGGMLVLPQPMVMPAYPVVGVGIEPVRFRQLNLTDESADDPAPNNSIRCRSYKELVQGDNLQQVVGNVLEDVLVPTEVTDPGPPPVVNIENQTRGVGAPISAGNANNSGSFFNQFAPGGAHYDAGATPPQGWLTPAELKVISEWIDIGAQYTNDSFSTLTPFSGCTGM